LLYFVHRCLCVRFRAPLQVVVAVALLVLSLLHNVVTDTVIILRILVFAFLNPAAQFCTFHSMVVNRQASVRVPFSAERQSRRTTRTSRHISKPNVLVVFGHVCVFVFVFVLVSSIEGSPRQMKIRRVVVRAHYESGYMFAGLVGGRVSLSVDMFVLPLCMCLVDDFSWRQGCGVGAVQAHVNPRIWPQTPSISSRVAVCRGSRRYFCISWAGTRRRRYTIILSGISRLDKLRCWEVQWKCRMSGTPVSDSSSRRYIVSNELLTYGICCGICCCGIRRDGEESQILN
jgi:hypothetical protein